MTRRIESERRESSTARVPTVPPGKAIVYTRYDEEKTVVMNPEDFHRFVEIDDVLAELMSADPVHVTELVRKAHELEDEPGVSTEDPAAIKALLGL